MRLALVVLAPLLALFGLAAAVHAQGGAINYGDNSSGYANNGECDDPRFQGEGMASILTVNDRMHDAVDCQKAVEAGKITYIALPAYRGVGAPPTIDEIDFGDDSSSFAFDRNCDDSRFGGRLMASILIEADIGHDATDCRLGMSQGELVFLGTEGETFTPARVPIAPAVSLRHAGVRMGNSNPRPTSHQAGLSAIDFGDNDSPFANNNECDDRRFSGEGMAGYLIDSDVLHDAADCRAAVRAGTVTYRGGSIPVAAGGIDYGDDLGAFAFNGECDDPRFEGAGMAEILINDDIRHDATDCAAAMDAGEIEFIGEVE